MANLYVFNDISADEWGVERQFELNRNKTNFFFFLSQFT